VSDEALPFAAACERNKGPILEVLKGVLPTNGTVLEVGSGTGQHIVFFATHQPALQWQPSDREEYLPGLSRQVAAAACSNILSPIELDVLQHWPQQSFAAIYSANTAHIMSWRAVCALFQGVSRRLQPGGPFFLYGPFNEGGDFTAPSNAAFDAQLKRENPAMGIRDIEALETLANSQQMVLERAFHLPANNQLLLFRSTGQNQERTESGRKHH
jgi:cyclopropane fatty-acyl-phospholipid synthase-like methyltransferase